MSKDTNKIMEELYDQKIMAKTPEERVKDTFAMISMAKKMVIASIDHDENTRQELFLRFYEDDFDGQTKRKILEKLK
ncbi:MAG: hypothetical protein A2015_05220 [Spirochaetes bacterium GWF1_31_7]|nr:MAG: hypothetical protein A2Y30_06615 [Spirochaetes bacterium GWE1_32_154]OHD47245.1 MAG: hypothetical protein A2015_05220 [Spirochaetes bacterium GWF1_31_7]OHD52811.1 MAG: hypothetical protein A2Y29_15565 [Spirochaetes bacterium GWE2_31_10]HBD94277.1 hypothetical protein [Spirochaetia bacterium]HBI36162.1 hypothetical protein [Spirochaetia bacterium]